MWVDGVGGFLVCTGTSVWLGRAVVEPRVDIPLAGDVQRRHAKLIWQAGRHALLAASPVKVNGRQVQELATLEHGDIVRLSDAVTLCYRQPPLLGPTALLDLICPARTVPWSDGIVLMGETLILGQSPAAHIVCSELSKALILVHRSGELFVQSARWVEIDGKRGRGLQQVAMGSRLVCEDVAITLEPRGI